MKEIIDNLGIALKEEIILVKTNGRDEWNSAYTRCSAIFLPSKKIKSYDEKRLVRFLLHEFFHVFFRARKDLQKYFYEVIGFKLINEIELPEDLKNRKLTNPDGPFINSCIEVKYENNLINTVPIILLKGDHTNVNSSKDILKSITVKLLVIEYEKDKWNVKMINEKPLLIDASQVKGFFEKVGENTTDIIDPDEILAENFVFLAFNERNVPSVNILDGLENVLKNAR